MGIKTPEAAYSKRGKFEKPDECYTPKEAILPLLEFLPCLNKTKEDLVIWDCAFGSGRLAEHFNDFGYDVVGYKDIDFLKPELEESLGFDVIITNPPYSIKDKFLERAFKIGKPFAFLLPTKALGEQKRGEMFNKYGIQMIIPHERINFEIPSKKKSAWFHTSWFVYGWNLPSDLNFVSIKELQKKHSQNVQNTKHL